MVGLSSRGRERERERVGGEKKERAIGVEKRESRHRRGREQIETRRANQWFIRAARKKARRRDERMTATRTSDGDRSSFGNWSFPFYVLFLFFPFFIIIKSKRRQDVVIDCRYCWILLSDFRLLLSYRFMAIQRLRETNERHAG